MAVKPVPDDSHTVTPSIMVKCAARLIEFLKEAFRGEEAFSMPLPSGEIQRAEVKIGDTIVMTHPAMHQPPTTTSLFLSVHDADAVYRRALKAGAISVAEPMDRFSGDRVAPVKDPCGNHWSIATHQDDVPPQETKKRAITARKQ